MQETWGDSHSSGFFDFTALLHGVDSFKGGIFITATTTLISNAVLKILGDLMSKAVSDGVDISKHAIKNAYQDRKSNSQNLQTKIYCVIVDSLNKFTHNRYKNEDKLYDAAESILKGLINGKCDAYAITSDLKILDPDVNINSHKDFLEILNHEISSDKNNVLYREFELLWKRQLSESLSNYFEKNNCNHEETHKKINKIEKMVSNYFKGEQNDTDIVMLQDNEREFVVTHNVNIKPVSYFTGRETDIKELRQKIENGSKVILVSGMGGIGKTHICRKLFEEYLSRHAGGEDGPFRHIGYIMYTGDMGYSLQRCLKYKKQKQSEQDQEAAWRELEYLASDGKLLLFVDNVDKPMIKDPGLQKLKDIPSAIVITSRLATMGDEFESYNIELLNLEQCKEIYEKIRFESKKRIEAEDIEDLEFIIDILAGRHTITVEQLAHLARTKSWSAKRLREELEKKRLQLTYHKAGEQINIQELYEVLYDLSDLSEAEKNILEAFSTFPYVPLVMDICNEWLLSDAGVSEDDDVLMGLYDKGWLQFDIESGCYTMHPVFAQFINEKCKPEEDQHLGLIEACKQSMETTGIEQNLLFYCPFALSIANRLHPAQKTRLPELLMTMIALAKKVSLELKDAINENKNLKSEMEVLAEELKTMREIIEERQSIVTQLIELNNCTGENPDNIDNEKKAAFFVTILNMRTDDLGSKIDHIKELINKIQSEKRIPSLQEIMEFINDAETEGNIENLDSLLRIELELRTSLIDMLTQT